MTNFITFKEAIRKEVIKEYDEVIIKSLYTSKNKIEISPQITGDDKVQTFGREEDLIFFFAFDEKKGQPYFYGDTTETKLRLSGKTGATHGVLAVNSACMPYSNVDVGLVARATTEWDIWKFVESKKGMDILNKMERTAWLGSSYISTLGDLAYFGMHIVDNGLVYNDNLYSSYGGTYSGCNGVRPAVSVGLPSKILVDEEKSVDGKWVLIPA